MYIEMHRLRIAKEILKNKAGIWKNTTRYQNVAKLWLLSQCSIVKSIENKQMGQ